MEVNGEASHSPVVSDSLQRVNSASKPLERRSCGSCAYDNGTDGLFRFLRVVPHFYLVPNEDLIMCAQSILRREYGSGDIILQAGEIVSHVYLVLSGSVEAFREDDCEVDPNYSEGVIEGTCVMSRIGSVLEGNAFGIDNLVFEEPSDFVYKSESERTVCGLIPGAVFDKLLARNVSMRQSIARKLADHMNVFVCFKDFCRQIFSHQAAKHEYLPIWNILDSYYRLNNCIHSNFFPGEVDIGAWGYAVKRLPNNLTTTFCFDLARALPPFLAKRMRVLARNPENASRFNDDVKYIETKERRRCSWQLGMEGKTLVLLRDGFTDLIDFITNLCIHIIESNKLRGRLQGMVHPPAIDILDEVLHGERLTEYESNPIEVTRSVLARMPLKEREKQGLMRIWPVKCLENIYSVIMHREEYMLRVDVSTSRRFQTDPFHEWSLNLRSAVMRKMKLTPQGRLPDDLVIDIVSSNTHCTKSILSPFARKYRDQILEYIRLHRPELAALKWPVEEDLVYASLSGFIQYSGLKEEYNNALQQCGIDVMQDTAMTGLQVDIVPVWRISMDMVDPALRSRSCRCEGERHFILNMDFAFGAQADGIVKTLVETFGSHIRSFNIMGKAGGIASTMRRGDIQLASHVLLSKSSMTTEDFLDELRSCGNEDLSPEFLHELLGKDSQVQVFTGPVLTIPGTMLQNLNLLRYYFKMWHCDGLEMEGSYFCRRIRESVKAGLLRNDIKTRFCYYTSDLPLRAATGDATLVMPMRPNEGVPPLYCIARAFMCRILGYCDNINGTCRH